MNERTTQFLVYVAVALIALTAGIVISHTPTAFQDGSGEYSTDTNKSVTASSCNIAVIKLEGGLMTYLEGEYAGGDANQYSMSWASSDHIVSQIEDADASSSIEAIVLQIDSTGGSPVAAEEIANALTRVAKPSIALIRGEGLSAAYWSATGADYIVAAENAEVGSIGVTSSYVDQSKHNVQSGFTFHSISTGEYKDILNSNKVLTTKEEALVRDEIGVMLSNFVNTISRNRGLAVASITPALTSGAPFIASSALTYGLIDQIGDKETVRSYLATTLHKARADMVYCK